MPKTRRNFWAAKINQNRKRDIEVTSALENANWRQLTIWECAFRGRTAIGAEETIIRAAKWICENEATTEIRGGAEESEGSAGRARNLC